MSAELFAPDHSAQDDRTAVAVIGAGPYGLSIAAHLRAAGIDHRVFGRPMQSWISSMPQGMSLKSHGFASNLYEPTGSFTLERYCAENSLPYAPEHLPVPLETFISYGLAFQQRFVPQLEDRVVLDVAPTPAGFRLSFDGEELTAQRVVVATGINRYGYVPPVLAAVPGGAVTHSSQHSSLAEFDGRSVAVIGGGSSALDLAALLHARGVAVEIFCRQPEVIIFDQVEYPRSLRSRLMRPHSKIGAGWRSKLVADGAPLYRRLPESFRLDFLHSYLGPAGGSYLRDQIIGKVPIHGSAAISEASLNGDRVQLGVDQADGGHQLFEFDRVIAATGYKIDLARLPFLGPELRSKIDCVGRYPAVSPAFESSVPGLYFAGITTAAMFGPLVRFACGAQLTAGRIARDLRRAGASAATTSRRASGAIT
jgi:lysine/ornithine N-monooxygenase